MFARIAPRYDLMNRLMSAGQDIVWRREAIRHAWLPVGGWLLDLGAGTGDLVFEAARQNPGCRAVAADLTPEMMRAGRNRQLGRKPQPSKQHPPGQNQQLGQAGQEIAWCVADAVQLPFPSESFDAVVSGFLLRNVPDLRQALAEQARVLIPGGWLVALDTTRPRPSPLSLLVQLHLRLVIPMLGRLVAGQPEAYRYLPDSTQGFLPAELLAVRMAQAGLVEVGFQVRMFGTVAIHWGRKLPEPFH